MMMVMVMVMVMITIMIKTSFESWTLQHTRSTDDIALGLVCMAAAHTVAGRGVLTWHIHATRRLASLANLKAIWI